MMDYLIVFQIDTEFVEVVAFRYKQFDSHIYQQYSELKEKR